MQKVLRQRQFLATAPSTTCRSWPADSGQHINVVHLTTADMQNSSCYRQVEALHGNGVMLGACIPNKRSILEHRTDKPSQDNSTAAKQGQQIRDDEPGISAKKL